MRSPWIELGQAGQRVVQRAPLGRRVRRGRGQRIEIDFGRSVGALPIAAPFCRGPGAGGIDQDAAHDSGRNREEVHPVLPVDVGAFNQPHVRFVHEDPALEQRVATFAPQITPGDVPQLVVDERRKTVRRPVVAVTPGFQQRCDLVGTCGHVIVITPRFRLLVQVAGVR